MPKPSEDRLLTDKEIRDLQRGMPLRSTDFNIMKRCLKAQRDLTVSIKDVEHYQDMFKLQCANVDELIRQAEDKEAECQERVERIIKWSIQPCLEHNTGGGVLTRRECPKCWQALIKEEGL